jgi:hypothetical protein
MSAHVDIGRGEEFHSSITSARRRVAAAARLPNAGTIARQLFRR